MNRILCWAVFFWLLLAMSSGASTTRIWVLNEESANIDVIDPVTNKVVQTIEGIVAPHGVAFSPDRSRAYVSSGSIKTASDNTLSVVDTKTGTIISKIRLSGMPNLPAINKDGRRIFVCIRDRPGAVDVVDTVSMERIKSLPMNGAMHDCYTTPDGKYVVAGSIGGNCYPTKDGRYVVATPKEETCDPRLGGNFAAVIDLETGQVAWEIPFDRGVLTMTFETNPDGSTRRIFVDLAGLHGFAVVDFAKRQEVSRILLSDKASGFKYPNPTHGMVIAPDGKTLWIGSRGTNQVFVYSLPELKQLGYVSTPAVNVAGRPNDGGDASWLAFTPDGKSVYVCNSDANLVSVIDTKSLKETTRIPVGKNPGRCATVVFP